LDLYAHWTVGHFGDRGRTNHWKGPTVLPEDLDAVTRSYHRCLHSEGFTDTFYEHFLAKSAAVAEKFRATDSTRQKRMLRESLLMMVMFDRDPEGVAKEMTKLAEHHNRRGLDIPSHLYDLWLDSLCEAVEQHDKEHTADLAKKWRAAMLAGINFFISKH
jgi:hemoglobin-like flavoprotein